MILFVVVPVCIIVAIYSFKDQWLLKLKTAVPVRYEDDGFWYEKRHDGKFQSYIKKAKCNYPKCNGTVHIVPAPPREKHNHILVGKCSVGGIRHTYTVDANFIGLSREFDWRPPEKEKIA